MASLNNDNNFINLILKEWARRLIQQRRENVRKTKSVASKELLNSYDYEIRKATIEQTAKVLIAFQSSGRFLDLKKINRKNKQVPLQDIKDWILDIGLDKFRRKGVKGKAQPVNNTRFLNDLAWGIVKKKRTKKHKRRKLQVGFEASILFLMDELREGYSDRTVQDIISSFDNKFSNGN